MSYPDKLNVPVQEHKYKEIFAQLLLRIHGASPFGTDYNSTPWRRQLFMVLIADLVSVLVHVASVKFVHLIANLCFS